MAHTLVSNVVHVIFGTKGRKAAIPEKVQPAMWSYIAGIAKHNDFKTIAVGGMDDHCHALIVLPSTLTLSKAVQLMKGGSSKWFREKHVTDFNWQRGFAGYSVSASAQAKVISYIRNQKTHHKKRDFKTEYIEFLEKTRRQIRPAIRVRLIGFHPPAICDTGMHAGSIYIRPRCGLDRC